MHRWIVVLAVTRATAAHAQASLDDFYERTRERDEGFTDCIGDTLPLWALVGYEWAGPRSRAVYQVGGAFVFDEFDFGSEAERHFELDPRTATFTFIDSGRFRAGVRTGPFHWSVRVRERISRRSWQLARDQFVVGRSRPRRAARRGLSPCLD